jgi:GcrA cell cycle regulator
MLRDSIGLPRAPRRRVSLWTKPRLRLLRRSWAQGARVREIAAELGHGITSNAVIAKIHRLGIARLSPYGGRAGRRYAGSTRAVDRPLRRHRAAYWFRKGPLPAWVVSAKPHIEISRADTCIPRRQRRSLFALSEHSCRWPIGDPRSSRFFFCGAQPLRNRPYCAEHCARAYRHPRAPPRGTAPSRHPVRPRNLSRMGEEPAVQTHPPESKNEIKTCAAAPFHQAPKATIGRVARAADAGTPTPRRRRRRAR